MARPPKHEPTSLQYKSDFLKIFHLSDITNYYRSVQHYFYQLTNIYLYK